MDDILYDLGILAEWPLDPNSDTDAIDHTLKRQVSLSNRFESPSQWAFWTLVRNVTFPFRSSIPSYLPNNLAKLVSLQIPWHIAISSDGLNVAILQDLCVEIRSARDEYSLVIGRCSIVRDPYPQWRKLLWSPDGTILAYTDSEGNVDILDSTATRICYINSTSDRNSYLPFDLSCAVCSLMLITYTKKEEWNFELLVLTYKGSLNSYLIHASNGRYEHQHEFHFTSHYLHGITSAIYDSSRQVIIVGGAVQNSKPTEMSSSCRDATSEGLTVWRRLDISPHYKRIHLHEDPIETGRVHGLLTRVSSHLGAYLWSSGNKEGIFKLCQSPAAFSSKSQDNDEDDKKPSGDVLVSIHLNGRLSVWRLPSLKLERSWAQDDQPDFDAVNSDNEVMDWSKKTPEDSISLFNLIDVNWWSDLSLILVRCSGSVTVSSLITLKNLLGKLPEWFEPVPRVSPAYNGGFLSLECERKYIGLKRHLPGNDDDPDADFDYDDLTYMQRCSYYAKGVLYYLTDSDSFRLPRKRPKLMSKTYRLLSFNSTTPEELYARKIDKEEYGEALELARAYHLDCDMVYQRQWRKTPVSIASIRDYLSKITKRTWVLHECIQPSHKDIQIDALRELFQYGLKGTGLQALRAIGNNEDGGKFLVCYDENDDDDNDEFVSIDDPYRDIDDEDTIERKKKTRTQREEELLAGIDFRYLTLEQREVCRARFKLLQYLDRLVTYEVMLGGPEAAEMRFDYQFYERFRSQNIVESAVEFARDGDWKSLDCIFTYHGDLSLEHRLVLLSNFPETLSPNEYRDLLPETGVDITDGEVLEWPQECIRDKDWCEREPCSSIIDPSRQDFGAFLYQDNPDYLKFRGAKLTKDMLTEWYRYRAFEVERVSYLTEHALELVHLALDRGVCGMSTLYNDLVTMECLVYDGPTDVNVTFDEFCKMTCLEKLQLLMSKSNEEMYEKNLRRWLVPYLDRCEAQMTGNYSTLLHNYLVSEAVDNLKPCFCVFQNSKVHQRAPIIRNEIDLLNIALDCIYACERDDAFSYANAIVECLPQRKVENISSEYIRLHNSVDELECHLSAAQILASHGLPKSLAYIRSTQNDFDETLKLMTRLCRLKGGKTQSLRKPEWLKLLSDILDLCTRVFKSLQPKLCTEIFTEGLMVSGDVESILLAGELIESCNDSSLGKVTLPSVMNQARVPYRRAVELVVTTAQGYFNSAAHLNDSCLELARSCLGLINDHDEDVKKELDLIDALALLQEYGVQILPLKVRLCQDRSSLIKTAMVARPHIYRDFVKLLKLGALLRVGNGNVDNEVGTVLTMVTQVALKCGDYKSALRHCRTLINRRYSHIWPECYTLVDSDQITETNTKLELLSFAITHCSPEHIDPMVRAKASLEVESQDNILRDPFELSLNELRMLQLKETVAEGNNPLDLTSALQSLAKKMLLKDTPLGLAYLLEMNVITDADLCIEALPRTLLTLQLSSYYYALQLYNSLKPYHKPTPHPMYHIKPQKLVDYVRSMNGAESGDIKELLEMLNLYNDLVADFMQGELLQSLGKGVDVARFTKDTAYKHETILGLAMTAEDDVFQIAIALAKKCNLSDWDLYMSHLDYLFSDSGLSTTDLEERVTRMDFMQILRQQPGILVEAMYKKIYPSISGSDHSRLLYFYQLLESSQTAEPVSPEQHVRLLRKIKPSVPGLDYKSFTSGKSDPLAALKPLLNATNVHVIAKLANKIPLHDNAFLQTGNVFACWASKFFWHGDQSAKKVPSTKADWIHRYENCGQLMTKMQPCDVLTFTDDILFSDQSLNLVLDCLQEIIKRSLKLCRQQLGKKKMEEDEGPITWEQAAEKLKQSATHLNYLNSETISAMLMSADDDIKKYGGLIHKSKGDTDNLVGVFRRMYMDGQGLEVVEDILNVLPLEGETPLSLFKYTIQYVLDSIRSESYEDDPMHCLMSMVKTVADHQDNGGEMIGQNDVMTMFRHFCSDITISVQKRLDVLLILEKVFTLTSEDMIMLTLYRTQAILSSVWPNLKVGRDDVITDGARHALFIQILQYCQCADGFKALKDLLTLWPALNANIENESSPQSHPWTMVFVAMNSALQAEAGLEIVCIVRELVNVFKIHFSEQCAGHIFELMRDLSPICAIKLVLLFAKDTLYPGIVSIFKDNLELEIDEETAQLILDRHLVTELVPTIYYKNVAQYLLSKEDAEADVISVCSQLEEAGYQIESGALLVQHRASHSMLSTFGTMFLAAKHWLKNS